MARDFKATQVETNKIIASGTSGATSPTLLIYSNSSATDQVGGLQANMLANVGNDVLLFVSGNKNERGTRGASIALFGGDIVVSGTLYAERSVIEVDVTTTGSLTVSGSLIVSQSATIRQGLTVNAESGHGSEADTRIYGDTVTLFHADTSRDWSMFQGDVYMSGNNANAKLHWDPDGDGAGNGKLSLGASTVGTDFTVYGTAASNYLLWDGSADKFSLFGDLEHRYGTAVFNESGADYDFRVESNLLQSAILVDAMTDIVLFGSNETTAAAHDGIGLDVNVFTSGTIGSKDSTTQGTAVFGGDVVASGTIYAGSYSVTPTLGTFAITASLVDIGWDPNNPLTRDAPPTLRLSQGHNSIQSGDILGGVEFYGDNTGGTGAGVGAKITAEATTGWGGSADDYPTELKFWTTDNGTTDGLTQRMVIDERGRVGINDSSPSDTLTISSSFEGNTGIGIVGGRTRGNTAQLLMTAYGNEGTSFVRQTNLIVSGATSTIYRNFRNDKDDAGLGNQLATFWLDGAYKYDASQSPNTRNLTQQNAYYDLGTAAYRPYITAMSSSTGPIMMFMSASVDDTSTANPQIATDLNFWVSGTIDANDTTTRGAAVFGGDVIISGGLQPAGLIVNPLRDTATRNDAYFRAGNAAAVGLHWDASGYSNNGSLTLGADGSGVQFTAYGDRINHFLDWNPVTGLKTILYAENATALYPSTAPSATGIGAVAIGDGNSVSGMLSAVVGGADNTASGARSFIGGGQDNTVTAGSQAIIGGLGNTLGGAASYSTIAGGFRSLLEGPYQFIGAGHSNTASAGANYSVVVGGQDNIVDTDHTHGFIGGGRGHYIRNTYSYGTIAGGYNNKIQNNRGFVGGGSFNTASNNAAVPGGYGNEATWQYSSVGGGYYNAALREYARIGGGKNNLISQQYGFIGGGLLNTASDYYTAIAGGSHNFASQDRVFIGSGRFNTGSGLQASVVGGEYNVASGQSSFVGGGSYNGATNGAATVAGGSHNLASQTYCFVGGGWANTASMPYATVAGGSHNLASQDRAFIGAGQYNTASADGTAVVGGEYNKATYELSFVGGGKYNEAKSGWASVVGGAYNQAAMNGTFIGAGQYNTASAGSAIVSGLENNTVAFYSLIGSGRRNTISNLVSYDAAILAGSGSTITTAAPGTIVIGSEITASLPNAVYLGGGGKSSKHEVIVSASMLVNPMGGRNDFSVDSLNRQKALWVDADQDRVLILSGGSGTSPTGYGNDTNFYVSGSIGSKDDGFDKGAAVFGGDVVISGSLHGGSPLSIGNTAQITGSLHLKQLAGAPSVNSNGAALYALDDSGTTKLYFKNSDGVGKKVGAGATPGDPVEGGIANEVLFVNAALNLTGSEGFKFTDGPSPTLFVSGSGTGALLEVQSSNGSTANAGSQIDLIRQRGTAGGAVQMGDTIGIMNWAAHDGTDTETTAALIEAVVNNNIFTNMIPTELRFATANNSGVMTPRLILDKTVLIQSGGHESSTDPRGFLDTNFFVSGSVGSKNSETDRGTAVFGGDVHISGSITSNGTAFVDGSGATSRIAYWSDVDTLTSDADLIFDGDTLTATNSSNTAIPTILIDRNYTGTTSIGNYVTDPQGLLVDYDVTGIVASGQTQVHDAIAINFNQDVPTHVGTLNSTGLDLRMTGGTSGTQSMKGVAISMTGADTNTGIDITVPNDGTHIVARSPDNLMDQFKISVGVGGATTLSTNDADAAAANLILNADGKIVINAVAGDETVFNESAADIDFRVESVNKPNMLYVDADTDRIGINTATPDRYLHIRETGAGNTTMTYAQRFESSGASGGDPATGFGVGVEFELENELLSNTVAGTIETRWQNDTWPQTSEIVLKPSSNSVLKDSLKISSDQVLVLSGGHGTSIDESKAGDVNFYVSGSINSLNTLTRGAALFGGDVAASGSLQVGQNIDVGEYVRCLSDPDTWIRFNGADTIQIRAGGRTFMQLFEGSEDIWQINPNSDDIDFQVHGGSTDKMMIKTNVGQNQLLLLSGGHGTSPNEAEYLDMAFFVSGSKGSKDSATDRGTALFGGDVVISGTLHGGSPLHIGSTTAITGAVYLKDQASAPPVDSSGQSVIYSRAGTLYFKNAAGPEAAMGGAPGGATTEIQFNDGGSTFGGDGTLTFNKASNFLSVEKVGLSGSLWIKDQASAPIVDASGQAVVYSRAGTLYFKNAGGTETAVGGGGITPGSDVDEGIANQVLFVNSSTKLTGSDGFTFADGVTPKLFISGSGNSRLLELLNTNNTAPGAAAQINLIRQRTTAGVAVSDGDSIGNISFTGHDGTDSDTNGAMIQAVVNGAVSSNTVPMELQFATMDSSGEFAGRLVLDKMVLINSGGNASSPDPRNYGDTNFFVSGSKNAKNTATNGASVFGGDLVVSGNAYLESTGYLAFADPTKTFIKSPGSDVIDVNTPQFRIGDDISDGSNYVPNDMNVWISGSIGSRGTADKGTTIFGGDAVVSGSLSVGTGSVGITSLNVYGNANGKFVALIDNDQSSSGHVLKLQTDGNGSASRLLEMEDGDGDILFRARADGRFGFGPNGVSSMGAGTFVVGIDGGHSADIAISKRLQHLGDSDTYMEFPTNNRIHMMAGGNEMLTLSGSTNVVGVNTSAQLTGSLHFKQLGLAPQVNSNGAVIYAMDDGGTTKLYVKNSSGLQSEVGGGGSGAPTSAQYITLATDGGLTNERVLAAGHGISLADKGAGNNVIISTSGTFNVGTGDEFVTTSSVSFAGGQGFNHTVAFAGKDTYFFTSGSVGSKNSETDRGTAVFGGDLVVSGIIHGGYDQPATMTTLSFNADQYILGNTVSDVMSPRGNDVNMFISGAINSKDTVTRGTAVFGGDVVVSGTLTATMTQMYHFGVDLNNTTTFYMSFFAPNNSSSVFDEKEHQAIAAYDGKITQVYFRPNAGDNVNSTMIDLRQATDTNTLASGGTFTSLYNGTTTNAASTTNAITVNPASNGEISAGRAWGISVMKNAGGNHGNSTLTVVVEWNLNS